MEMEMTAVYESHEHKNIYKPNEIVTCVKLKGNIHFFQQTEAVSQS